MIRFRFRIHDFSHFIARLLSTVNDRWPRRWPRRVECRARLRATMTMKVFVLVHSIWLRAASGCIESVWGEGGGVLSSQSLFARSNELCDGSLFYINGVR